MPGWGGRAAQAPVEHQARWIGAGDIRRSSRVKLDANGNGSVQFDTYSANQQWVIGEVIVSTNQAQTVSPYPQVVAYVGGQQAATSEGASWLGNQVTMRGSITLGPCDTLTVQFSGGSAGSVATVTIEGTNHLWR